MSSDRISKSRLCPLSLASFSPIFVISIFSVAEYGKCTVCLQSCFLTEGQRPRKPISSPSCCRDRQRDGEDSEREREREKKKKREMEIERERTKRKDGGSDIDREKGRERERERERERKKKERKRSSVEDLDL